MVNVSYSNLTYMWDAVVNPRIGSAVHVADAYLKCLQLRPDTTAPTVTGFRPRSRAMSHCLRPALLACRIWRTSSGVSTAC